MTELRIDELLDEHVPAFKPRSEGWEDVFARAHTTSRRSAALVVAALAVLLVPTAVALRGQIADLFEGTPAPPAVSTSFEANNKVADMATQKGFGVDSVARSVLRRRCGCAAPRPQADGRGLVIVLSSPREGRTASAAGPFF